MSEDDPVIQTNDEASFCKKAAVDKGYWQDPFIQFFVKSTEHKAPEISRGYFARVHAVQMLVEKFLEITGPNSQIVNLGCGFDTLYWRLMSRKSQFKAFIEVDLPQVTNRKSYYIRLRKPLLKAMVNEVEMQDLHLPMGTRSPTKKEKGGEKVSGEEAKFSSCDLHTHAYHLVGADLRHVTSVEQKLKECSIDFSLPTVFISECVLVYMPVNESDGLLSFIGSRFTKALYINYDPVNMSDKFAQIMVDNLAARHCLLTGVDACKSLKTQEERFTRAGFDSATAYSMLTVYQSLPKEEIDRISRIEMLDEIELLHQLLQHYSITVAHKGASKDLPIDTIKFQPNPQIRI